MPADTSCSDKVLRVAGSLIVSTSVLPWRSVFSSEDMASLERRGCRELCHAPCAACGDAGRARASRTCNRMLESHGLSFPNAMRAVLAASVFAAALGVASTAMALSLGAVSNASRLGQPLDFAVAVKLDPEEALPPHCVFAEVTAGDNRIPPGQVRARLIRSGRSAEAVARISTTVRLNEPVVTVTLS